MRAFFLSLLVFMLAGCSTESSENPPMVEPNRVGNASVWHTSTFFFVGPFLSETRETFTDYKLTVIFNHPDGDVFAIPGYFAGSGDAANDSSTSGNIWHVKFTPPKAGAWSYETKFTVGPNAAIISNGSQKSAGHFDGVHGEFDIWETELTAGSGGDTYYEIADDKTGDLIDVVDIYYATPFYKKGMLQDVKGRYLQFSGTKDYFLKTGAGSPENILAYADFDGTYDVGGTHFPALGDNQLHEFKPHLQDARDGDPTWGEDKGKAILGIANYYEEVGVNAQYLVTMNVEGDGQDVFPWVSHDDPYVFDVSKLAQWQRVFEHFNARGVLIDMLLTETENESWFEAMDGVEIGKDFADSRKLYYREMVARFGHLNGLVFNLGEENGVIGNSGQDPFRQATSAEQRLNFGAYIEQLDPYNHAIVSHNWPDAEKETYGPKIAAQFWSGISLQAHYDYARRIKNWSGPHFKHDGGKTFIEKRPWMVTVDEPLGWEFGARPDDDVENHRREIEGVLWPTLLAGGAGVDWYFGWQNNAPSSDLSNEDQRSRDLLWRASKRVADFIRETIDVTSLETTIVENGTLVAKAKDRQGRDVKITLERRKPEIPEGEGHQPWEYSVEGLAFERGGKVIWLDPMNPKLPSE